MQKISDKIGENQYAITKATCCDCHKEFPMNFERTGPEKIVIKNGAVGKRDGQYFFKCEECWGKDQSFGQKCDVYSRVVGYLRPTRDWNDAKRAEFGMRKTYNIEKDLTMTEFNESRVVPLVEEIEGLFVAFLEESKKPTVKAKARRARKSTAKLEKLLKEYRKISIK